MQRQRAILTVLCVLAFIRAEGAFSHSYEGCENLDNGSCWHSINTTGAAVTIDCNQGEFLAQHITNQTYSYQFCPGWGDGLGYPEPNTFYQCNVLFPKGEVAKVAFNTIGWGDRVQILIRREDITVHLRAKWTDQQKTYQVLRLRSELN